MLKANMHAMMGVIMYALLIIMMSFSCAHLITQKNLNNSIEPITLENSSDTPFNNNNFVSLTKYYLQDGEGNYCKIEDECKQYGGEESLISTASAGAIKIKKGNIYTLTAAHFCVNEDDHELGLDEGVEAARTVRASYMGINTKANIEFMDEYNDICLVSFAINKISKIQTIKLAKKMPNIGDIVYAASAPLSITGPTFRIHVSGHYSGCDPLLGCLYTLPATFGSSGSLVLDKKGNLISMIQISVMPFNHVSAGPSVHAIKYFLQQYEEKSGIKLY